MDFMTVASRSSAPLPSVSSSDDSEEVGRRGLPLCRGEDQHHSDKTEANVIKSVASLSLQEGRPSNDGGASYPSRRNTNLYSCHAEYESVAGPLDYAIKDTELVEEDQPPPPPPTPMSTPSSFKHRQHQLSRNENEKLNHLIRYLVAQHLHQRYLLQPSSAMEGGDDGDRYEDETHAKPPKEEKIEKGPVILSHLHDDGTTTNPQEQDLKLGKTIDTTVVSTTCTSILTDDYNEWVPTTQHERRWWEKEEEEQEEEGGRNNHESNSLNSSQHLSRHSSRHSREQDDDTDPRLLPPQKPYRPPDQIPGAFNVRCTVYGQEIWDEQQQESLSSSSLLSRGAATPIAECVHGVSTDDIIELVAATSSTGATNSRRRLLQLDSSKICSRSHIFTGVTKQYVEALIQVHKRILWLDLSESSKLTKDRTLDRAKSYENVGDKLNNELFQHSLAMDAYKKALAIRQTLIGDHVDPLIATLYTKVGHIFANMGNRDESISYYQKALMIREAVLDEGGYGNGDNDNAIREYHMALHLYEAAKGKPRYESSSSTGYNNETTAAATAEGSTRNADDPTSSGSLGLASGHTRRLYVEPMLPPSFWL